MIIYLEAKEFEAARQAQTFTERYYCKPSFQVSQQCLVHDASRLPCERVKPLNATVVAIVDLGCPEFRWLVTYTCSELMD